MFEVDRNNQITMKRQGENGRISWIISQLCKYQYSNTRRGRSPNRDTNSRGKSSDLPKHVLVSEYLIA